MPEHKVWTAALIVIGAVDSLLMPKYFARQWRTPPAP